MDSLPSKRELEELYWDKGLSLPELAKIYGVSVKTVWRWMKKHGIPRRERDKAKFDKYWKNERPVDLSKRGELAYILGVMYGDGSLVFNPKSYGYILKLAVAESGKEFAIKFAYTLQELGIHPYVWVSKRTPTKHEQNVIEVRGMNKRLFMFIKRMDLTTLRDVIRGYEDRFICGFYESEGHYYRNKKYGFERLSMSNTDYKLITFVKRLLEEMGFHPKLQEVVDQDKYTFGKIYRLNLYRKGEIERFFKIIQPIIKNRER